MTSPRIAISLILLACVASLRTQAASPVPAPRPEPGAKNDEAVMLSPFVVSVESDIGYRATNTMSATKTNTSIQDAPQSIQVINREFILDQGAFSLDDTMRYTSGISEGTDIRGDRYTMRGFVTGIPSKDAFRDTGRAPREMSNIERVEVVKGPAAFTFGRTNPGGVINMVLKRPLMQQQTEVTGVVGSDAFYRGTLDTTGPIGETKQLAYRFIAANEDSQSFRDGFFVHRKFVTPSVLWKISPKTSLRVEAEYLDDNRTPNRGLVMLDGKVPDNIPLSFNYQWDKSRINSVQYNYLAELLHQFNSHVSLRVASRYNNTDEFGYVTNISAVSAAGDLTRNVQRSNDVVIDNRYSQIELVITGNTGGFEHNILAGTELGWNDADQVVDQSPLAATNLFAPDRRIAPTSFKSSTNNRTDTAYKSFYIQDQVYFWHHHMALLAGGRRDSFIQNAVNRKVSPASFERISGDFTDPRLGLAWIPNAELTVYGLYTTSNVQPTQANPNGQVLKPSVGSIYEAGIKGSFFEQRLTSTLALYKLDQNNVAVMDPDNVGYLLNVGSREVKGAEIDATYIITNAWTILASGAYSHGEVTRDTLIPVGSPLAQKPDWQGSAWTRYDFKRGALRNLTLGLGWIYSDSIYVDNAGKITLPGFTRWDGLVRYRWKRIDLSVNLRNLFDRRYFQSAASAQDVKPGTPFTVQTSVRLRF